MKEELHKIKDVCPPCEGKGYVTDILKTCRECDGSGFVVFTEIRIKEK